MYEVNNIHEKVYRSKGKKSDKPYGWVIGKWFIGNLTSNPKKTNWIIAHDDFVKKMDESDIIQNGKTKSETMVWLHQRG